MLKRFPTKGNLCLTYCRLLCLFLSLRPQQLQEWVSEMFDWLTLCSLKIFFLQIQVDLNSFASSWIDCLKSLCALVPLTGSSLSVSGRVQSASALNQRGVSYPPPSPRGLTRAQPVPQSRNPPLVKTRRLASVTGHINVNVIDSTFQHSASVEIANSNLDLGGLTSTRSY